MKVCSLQGTTINDTICNTHVDVETNVYCKNMCRKATFSVSVALQTATTVAPEGK